MQKPTSLIGDCAYMLNAISEIVQTFTFTSFTRFLLNRSCALEVASSSEAPSIESIVALFPSFRIIS